ncbi:NAD(P)-dependent alcohol dehydrogenase [Spirosoma aerophilum]
MKTVVYHKFGGTDVLQITEAPMPTPGTHDVLVNVKAVSINPLDGKIRRGEMKLMSGTKFPKGVGVDFAGVVTAVGAAVTGFSVGDDVFGAVDTMKGGALAEYIAVPAKSVWHKPSSISFAQAASIMVVGSGAYTALVELGHIKEGSEVLLNGASGGMGMVAIQLAKQAGAVVTAVAGPAGLPFVQKWGADRVVDYTKQDVRELTTQFDIIFDLSAKLPFHDAKPLMKEHAVFINPVPQPVDIVTTTLTNLVTGKKDKMLLSSPGPASANFMLEAIGKGLQIEVTKTFPLADVIAAYQYTEKGSNIGKTVIEL